jgi:hypothetical protein
MFKGIYGLFPQNIFFNNKKKDNVAIYAPTEAAW